MKADPKTLQLTRDRLRATWTKTILIGFLLITSALWNKAAEPGSAGPAFSADEMRAHADEFKARLHLSPEQLDKLKPLLQEEGTKLRAIKDKYAADNSRSARRSKLREAKSVQKDFDGKLEKILSPDQMKQWKKLRKERHAKLKEEYKHRNAAK